MFNGKEELAEEGDEAEVGVGVGVEEEELEEAA